MGKRKEIEKKKEKGGEREMEREEGRDSRRRDAAPTGHARRSRASNAGGIRGVVYGWSATRASRGEEDGTTGVRDRETISGFEV